MARPTIASLREEISQLQKELGQAGAENQRLRNRLTEDKEASAIRRMASVMDDLFMLPGLRAQRGDITKMKRVLLYLADRYGIELVEPERPHYEMGMDPGQSMEVGQVRVENKIPPQVTINFGGEWE